MEESDKVVELQEQLSESLLAVAAKRTDAPEQCAKLLYHNLKLRCRNEEKVIFLPKKNFKKFPLKYGSLDKLSEETSNLETNVDTIRDMALKFSHTRENQVNLLKVINLTTLKRSS